MQSKSNVSSVSAAMVVALLTTVTAASHYLSWREATGWQDVAWQWGGWGGAQQEMDGAGGQTGSNEEWGRGQSDGKDGRGQGGVGCISLLLLEEGEGEGEV